MRSFLSSALVLSLAAAGFGQTFDLNVTSFGLASAPPADSTATVEPRNPAAGTGAYSVVFSFNEPIRTSPAPTATATGGAVVGTISVSGNDVIVPLTSIPNQQVVTITLNAADTAGNGNAYVAKIGYLIGDVDGNRVVNAGDSGQTRSSALQALDGTNFRRDVDANGTINAGDAGQVRSRALNALP